LGALASAQVSPASTGPAPTRSSSVPASAPAAPASTAFAPSPGNTDPLPVAVSITVTPTSGTCSTDFTFVAHFLVNETRKYRWHWVFGGPGNYSSISGDHDQDKTGDVKITRKFDAHVSGTFWAQVVIIAPLTVTSNQAGVQVTCDR
jgi:hypothetical protein